MLGAMRLDVPAVFDVAFLDALAGLPVARLYGSLPDDPSLRPSGSLPGTSGPALAEWIGAARRRGLPFWYALNVACLGNREFTAEGQRWLVERLGFLSECGVAGVVLGNPYLVGFTRRRFPDLDVAVSTAVGVDTVDKARFFEDMGVELLCLPEYVNRDFRLLEDLRRGVRCRIALLVNVGCLARCPVRGHHVCVVSHNGESHALGTWVDYPLLVCTREKVRDPVQLLRSPWIRPEDLRLYEELGYDEFKLAGREMEPEWIEQTVRAFAARRWDGDLNDLVLGLDHLEPFGRLPVRIPNRALDGFAEMFRRKHDCRLGCRECHHCEDWAGRTLVREGSSERFAAHIGRTLARFEAGAFRSAGGR